VVEEEGVKVVEGLIEERPCINYTTRDNKKEHT
jgi:hypothetical protein